MSSRKSNSEKLAMAVASDLSTASNDFEWSFLAKFNPLPQVALKDIPEGRPLITVRDVGQRVLGLGSRDSTEHEYDIEVLARAKVSSENAATLSRMKLLAEELTDHFWMGRPTDCDETLDRIDAITIAPDAELNEQLVCRLSMTLVFHGWRDRP